MESDWQNFLLKNLFRMKLINYSVWTVINSHLLGNHLTFYAISREDADVLMLGSGRPFYLELINPRNPFPTAEELEELQQLINLIAEKKVEL